MFYRNTILAVCAAVLVAAQIPAITAQQTVKVPNPATDWPMFSHDLSGTRYSPLKQITSQNASKLKLAWSMPYRADRKIGRASCRERVESQEVGGEWKNNRRRE